MILIQAGRKRRNSEERSHLILKEGFCKAKINKAVVLNLYQQHVDINEIGSNRGAFILQEYKGGTRLLTINQAPLRLAHYITFSMKL